jgi:hypothetical protein
MSQETVAAQDMLTRFAAWQGRAPESAAADTTYGNGEFLQWLANRQIIPYNANSRQYPQKEQPVLRSRAFHLPARTQSLYLSRWPAPQLWRTSLSESRLQLYWNPETLWRVCPKISLHQRAFSVSEHPPARTRAATRTGVSQHASVCSRPATEKESGSTVCRIEKPDRAASPAEIEVRARAVLPGRGCAKHQTACAVPKSTNSTTGAHHLKK